MRTRLPFRPSELEDFLIVANNAVDVASSIIKRVQIGNHHVNYKQDRDPVSQTDLAVENAVSVFLKSQTPDVPFLGEEYGWSGGKDGSLYWVLDPIDGTVNFSREIPLFAISLALVFAGSPILSVVDAPLLSERYIATAGGGAWCNKSRLSVSNVDVIHDAVVGMGDFAVGAGAEGRNQLRFAAAVAFGRESLRLRLIGSASIQLAWVAAGRLDAGLTLSNRPWDVLAGVLLVREAGGEVFDSDGSPHSLNSRWTLASNTSLKSQIIDKLGTLGSRQRDDENKDD
ncbi:MAG: inositol monophosphatase family protein [Dehalococcoidia bacterium]